MATVVSQSRLERFIPSTSAGTAAAAENGPGITASPARREDHPQRVYVLCGVVGSGKSTLAVQLEAIYPNDYVRVNQDSLGNRKKCEDLSRDSLARGKSVIIDRQNFDVSQRYTWLELGHLTGVEVVALVFSTSKQTCADRLRLRRGHETIKSAEQGVAVLESILPMWQPPTEAEGFHRIVQLSSSLPLRYSVQDVNSVLDSVDSSPPLAGILGPEPPPSRPRGQPFGSRGRGSPARGRGAPVGSRNVMSSWLAAPAASASSGSSYGSARNSSSTMSLAGSAPARSRGQDRSRPYTARGGGPAGQRSHRGGCAQTTTSKAPQQVVKVSSDEEA